MRSTLSVILCVIAAVSCNIIKVPLHADLAIESLEKSGDYPIYYGKVNVGTPPQSFLVSFDTTSGDFWVPNTRCHTSAGPCNNPSPKFDKTLSSTWRKNGSVYEINYSTGTVIGTCAFDTVEFAGITIPDQLFGETTNEVGDDLQKIGFDGYMGLGFKALAWRGTPPIINAYQTGLIGEPVFSLHFSKTASSFNGAQLTIGGSSPDLYTGDLTYVPVTQPKYWQFTLDSLTVGSQSLGSNLQTIIDSTSPFISGPAAIIDPINQAIGAQQISGNRYEVSCANLNSLPDVTLTIGGKNYVLKPENYSVQSSDGKCTSYFATTDINPNKNYQFIVGYVFLANYYTVFDFGQNRLGFANSV